MSPPTSETAIAERPPLRRASDDRLLLGLCAGTARSLDLSPLAVRLFAVALAAVAAPIVLALYVVLAAIVPRDDGRAMLGGTPTDRRESLLGWALVGLTLIWFAGEDFHLDGLVWPGLSSFGVFAAAASALALLAVAQRREGAQAAASAAPPAAEPAAAEPAAAAAAQPSATTAPQPGSTAAEPGADLMPADTAAEPGADLVPASAAAAPGAGLVPAADTAVGPPAADPLPYTDSDAVTMPFATAETAAQPSATAAQPSATAAQAVAGRPPRRGPSVAVLGFGVLLIAGAVAFLLDAVGEIDLSAEAVAVALAAGAALAGAGAIAGAITRRRGVLGLLALGVVLGAAAAGGAYFETELDDGIGLRTERPLTVSEIPETYRLGAGELDIDLRDIDLPAGPTTVRARIGAGELTVLVPPGVRVESIGPTEVTGVRRINAALEPAERPAGKRRRAAQARAEAARPVVRIDADVREGDAGAIRVGG
jgi:phage shock protein PspC (stress-responsive transcriptional regulator)